MNIKDEVAVKSIADEISKTMKPIFADAVVFDEFKENAPKGVISYIDPYDSSDDEVEDEDDYNEPKEGYHTVDHLHSDREREIWLESCYPLTVINDRYCGTYSGGQYTAFPTDYWQIPKDGPDGSDVPCCAWWNSFVGYVGLGETVDEAIKNLIDNVANKKLYSGKNVLGLDMIDEDIKEDLEELLKEFSDFGN